LLIVVPRYKKLFDEFGLKVSGTVELILTASGWVQKHVLFAFLVTFLLIGSSVGPAHYVQTAPVSKSRRLIVLLLVFAVPCAIFLLVWLGMFSTERKLAEGFQR
jgi:type II secretory pathway component PulF